jgi:hypothetical protein
MIFLILGVALLALGAWSLWYFAAGSGQAHRLPKMSPFDSLIPIAIICAIVFGLALIVRGFV